MSGTPSSDAPIISPDEPYNPDAAPADAPAPAPEAADGPADEVVHTTDDAGNAIDVHYDEAGEVVLIEADTDGDGQIDTAAAPTADGGAVIASDLDSDGVVDEVAHLDGQVYIQTLPGERRREAMKAIRSASWFLAS